MKKPAKKDPRQPLFNIRLSPEDRATLEAGAEADGRTLGDFLRWHALAAAKRLRRERRKEGE